MLQTTEAILLQTVKYGDTSLIIKTFTKEYGVKSFIVKGIFKKKSNSKNSRFQLLSTLQITAYLSNKSQLLLVKEITPSKIYLNCIQNIYKSSILLFINEVINNSIKEGDINEEIYRFIEETLSVLENEEKEYFNIHLIFLKELSKYLGFKPFNNYTEKTPFFNLQEASFENIAAGIWSVKEDYLNKILHIIFNSTYKNMAEIAISLAERREIVSKLLEYYKHHINDFKEIKSHKILETVLA